MSADDLILSEDQLRGLDAIDEWFHAKSRPYFTLGGYAGCGKSTLVGRFMQESAGLRVAVCAFTGKAAHVLRTKGIKRAKTIHSTIYAPTEICKNCEKPLAEAQPQPEWHDVPPPDDEHGAPQPVRIEYAPASLVPTPRIVEIRRPQPAPGCNREPGCAGAGTKTRFDLIPELDAKLIVVDEASMVSSRIHEDLLSFGIPILYVGDHGQLEPIGPNPKLMLDPHFKLEKIHRQAEGSDILQFAQHVRTHGEPKSFGRNATVLETKTVPRDAHEYDIVLCGKNATRVAVNAWIRKKRGYTQALPEPGESVVCLRNNREHQIFNGMLATVLEVRADDRVDHPEIDIVDDEGVVRRGIRFAPDQFGCEELLETRSRKTCLFDFGYALTCHKSQGSEWGRVLVLEWFHRDTSAARWRYTAATRASEQLVWCRR